MIVSFIPTYPYQEAVWLHSQGGNRAPLMWVWLCLVWRRGCVLLPNPTCPCSVGLCPHNTCFSHSWHHNSSTYWHQGKDMRDDNNSAFLSLDQGKGLLTQLQEADCLLKHHLKQAFPAHRAQHIMCLSRSQNSKMLCEVLKTFVSKKEMFSCSLNGGILAAALATVFEKPMPESHDSHKDQPLKSWLICTHS